MITPFPRVDAIRFNLDYKSVDTRIKVPEAETKVGSLKLIKQKLTEFVLRNY